MKAYDRTNLRKVRKTDKKATFKKILQALLSLRITRFQRQFIGEVVLTTLAIAYLVKHMDFNNYPIDLFFATLFMLLILYFKNKT